MVVDTAGLRARRLYERFEFRAAASNDLLNRLVLPIGTAIKLLRPELANEPGCTRPSGSGDHFCGWIGASRSGDVSIGAFQLSLNTPDDVRDLRSSLSHRVPTPALKRALTR
jgi:hypothetical protein